MGKGIRTPALEALKEEGEADSSRDSQGAGDSSLLTRAACGGGRGRPRGPVPGDVTWAL